MLVKFVIGEWSTYKELSPELCMRDSIELMLFPPISILAQSNFAASEIRCVRVIFLNTGRKERTGVPIFEYVE